MTPYELKKLQVEFKRVNAAREEQELRVLEFEDQIIRIKASIQVSLDKEQELQEKLQAASK